MEQTFGQGSPVRECRTPGSVRGVRRNAHPYRNKDAGSRCSVTSTMPGEAGQFW
jgi:hypothetical protein